ncbi:MAG TPA: quinone oxidoreductase [Myxococcales bacterium]|nr:quinone oxidoreductase [Myxococcales bacterium]
MARVVRAQKTGGPEVMKLEEVQLPQPGPGQALVRIEAAGVNFIDIYHRSGQYQLPLPLSLGVEGAGVVEQVGSGVSDIRTGQRVAWTNVNGTYATHAVVPAERLVPVPEGVSGKVAAAVMLQGMTAHYLTHDTYPLKRGEWCVIHAAAGGVGLLFCQIAKRIGARTIGTAGNEEKARLARQAGAEEVIVYTKQDFEAEVRRLTGGTGASVVYDSVGKDTFDRSLKCLRRRGMLVLFGQSSGAVPPFDLQRLSAGGSLYITRPTLGTYIFTREELLARAGAVLDMVRRRELDVKIEAEIPLAEAPRAHELLASRKTTGKLILVP